MEVAIGLAVRRLATGPDYPQAIGWTFWEYQRADGTLGLLDELRREFHESKVVSLDDGRRMGQGARLGSVAPMART